MNKNNLSVLKPNERLKQERILHSWTQADLAGFLGTDGYTVNRWERGRTRPSLFFIQKLCELFEKSAEDLDLLPALQEYTDTNTRGYPTLWSVPYAHNPFFTGREDFLEMLHTSLGVAHRTPRPTCALRGLGGIGKTQLALEYAYRYASEYQAIFWIGAERVKQALSNVLYIADLLQLREREDTNRRHSVEAVQHWLATHDKWLLIWDNLEDLNLLQRWLSPGRQGSILITTRSQTLGTLAQGIDLTQMQPEEATLLLLRRAKILEPQATNKGMQQFAARVPAEYAASAKLAEAAGGLPLALDQIGAYIEETGCNIADYMQHYERMRVDLLNRRGEFGFDHPDSVTATFVLASKRVEQELGSAADILRVCALLESDAIPEELFTAGAIHLGPTLEALAANSTQLDQSIAVLRKESLVQRHPATHTLSLHCLVQTAIQARMSEQERTMWLRRIITALNAIFPDVISDTWNRCERLLPHVLVVAAALPDTVDDQVLAEILQKAADYLRERNQYQQAEALYQRALRLGEQALEAEHLVSHTLNGMALLRCIQGKYAEAEQLYQRVLGIGNQKLGPMHFEVARSLHNLGSLHQTQGRYVEAETLYLQAKFILEQALGPEHPKLGHPLLNLAMIYLEQEQYERAEVFCKQALYLWKQTLGSEHSLIANALRIQARLFVVQQQEEQAELTYQQALHIWEKTIGTNHPQIALLLNDLANLYVHQKRYRQAELLYQRARTLLELHQGSHHPETARTLHDLAILRSKLGQQDEAVSLLEQALKIRAQSLGDIHPKTIATRTQYLQLSQRMGQIDRGSCSCLWISETNDSNNISQEQPMARKPQEQKRDQILRQLLVGTVSTEQAAKLLGCSQRHLYRLKARYREKGIEAFAHGERKKNLL